jgi:pyruvate/oxaloacetate carboxyltransferase
MSMADKTTDAIKLNLRLPKPLHRRIKQQAKRNNVSLNTEIVNQLEGAEAATAKRMADALRPALDHAIEEAIQKATRQTQRREAEIMLSIIMADSRAPSTEEELRALLERAKPADEVEEMIEMFREIQDGTRIRQKDFPFTWIKPEQK